MHLSIQGLLLVTSGCGTRTDLDGYTQPQDHHPYVVAISASDFSACSLWSNGTVRCWGNDNYGHVSAGTTYVNPYRPVLIEELAGGVVGLSAGFDRMCVVMDDSSVWCWGKRYDSDLRDVHPTPVQGLSGVRSLSTGYQHSCAALADGTARCWGQNIAGQLGNGATTTQLVTTPPAAVLSLRDVESVGTGDAHSCGLLRDTTVRRWGANYQGLLGDGADEKNDGTPEESDVPVAVVGLSGVHKIAVGFVHTCAQLVNGTVQCWGHNEDHQLGTGDLVYRSATVLVQGLTDVVDIATGLAHSCAALADGTVRCWGDFGSTQSTKGGTSRSTVPVAIVGLRGVQHLAAGRSYTCALLDDHSVWCWGVNDQGQLGDGTARDSNVPVEVQWQ